MDSAVKLHGLVDLSNADYHSGPGISSSHLHVIAESGRAYWDKYINPDREPEDTKHCFAVGDGTHKLVLEPGTFERTYAVGFDKSAHPDALDTVADLKKELSARGLMVSGSKPELAERLVSEGEFPSNRVMLFLERAHAATMAGRIPISARDYKNMLASLRAIAASEAAPLLAGADTEQSFFVRVPYSEFGITDQAVIKAIVANGRRLFGNDTFTEDGALLKCRTDAITANGGFVIDLKTTDDVSEEGFRSTISRRRYHVSGAWYLDVLFRLYGDDAPSGFAFIAAQKGRPYDVAVHWLNDQYLHLGRLEYRRDMAELLRCVANDDWPGVARGEFIEAKPTTWDIRRLELLEGAAL